jgi:hypothetical protein
VLSKRRQEGKRQPNITSSSDKEIPGKENTKSVELVQFMEINVNPKDRDKQRLLKKV